MPQPISAHHIADFLRKRLQTQSFPDVPLVWRPREQPIQTLGMALEARPELSLETLDALFLHRPFDFTPPPGSTLGVFAAHRAFDAHLTTAYNPALAHALHLQSPQPIEQRGKIVGTLAHLSQPLEWQKWRQHLRQQFGGLQCAHPQNRATVHRVALMDLMTVESVELAASLGVDNYLTGQLRWKAQQATLDHALSLVCIGHQRVERWGLRQLERELQKAFPLLKIINYG